MYINYTEFGVYGPSVFETYMKGINLEDVGDLDMNTDKINEDIPDMLKRRKILQEKMNNGWHPLNYMKIMNK